MWAQIKQYSVSAAAGHLWALLPERWHLEGAILSHSNRSTGLVQCIPWDAGKQVMLSPEEGGRGMRAQDGGTSTVTQTIHCRLTCN